MRRRSTCEKCAIELEARKLSSSQAKPRRGGGRSPSRTRLHSQIPLLTGKLTGNFSILDPDSGSGVAIHSMIQRTWNEIPYSTEQGIFAKEQGICTREQGI